MMLFRKIEEIEAWKRGCRLAVRIYESTAEGRWERDWSFRDQLRRAAVSIPSNIAEGYERGTVAEFRHFASIAKGSCGELRTQLYIVQAIKYLSKAEVEPLLTECTELSSMIASLSLNFKPRSKKTSESPK